MTTIGFNEPLYISPFNHRGSFQTKMFGWSGQLNSAQTAEIAAAKSPRSDRITPTSIAARTTPPPATAIRAARMNLPQLSNLAASSSMRSARRPCAE